MASVSLYFVSLLVAEASCAWSEASTACFVCLSVRTVSVKDFDWLLPALSVAAHVTVVTPNANVLPDAGAQPLVARPLVLSLKVDA